VSTTATQPQSSPTPILDRLVPLPGLPKPRRVPGFVISLFGVLIAYGVPGLMIYWNPPFVHTFFYWAKGNLISLFSNDWAGVRVILTGFSVALAFLAATAVHEFGHLLVGVAAGFRFEFLRLSGIQISRNLKVSRYHGSDGQHRNGIAFFTEEMRNRPWRVACMILAGPVANLASGYVLLMLPFHKSFASGSFILVSFVIGVMNLVPFRRAQTTSDGMRILVISRSRAKHERWLAVVQILEQRLAGVAPEHLSDALIATAIGVRDKSLETVVAHLIAYEAAYNQHKDNEAAQLLETCLLYAGYATSSTRESLIGNAGIFQAERRNRIDLAAQWLADLPANPQVPYARLMVEGAILEAQKDYPGALHKVDKIRKAILANTKSERQHVTLALFEKWRAELDHKARSSAARPVSDL
jgi:hypothetical protein